MIASRLERAICKLIDRIKDYNNKSQEYEKNDALEVWLYYLRGEIYGMALAIMLTSSDVVDLQIETDSHGLFHYYARDIETKEILHSDLTGV